MVSAFSFPNILEGIKFLFFSLAMPHYSLRRSDPNFIIYKALKKHSWEEADLGGIRRMARNNKVALVGG